MLLVLLAGSFSVAAYLARNHLKTTRLAGFLGLGATNESKAIYICPMHPQIRSEKPGTCPICNMNLEKMEDSQATPDSAGKPASEKRTDSPHVIYYCPMHPQVQSDKPGTCPICHMDLERQQEGNEAAEEAATAGTIYISPKKQQLIGIQLTEVTLGPLSSTIRAVGRLTYDETRISRIQTKIEGWIEEVAVNYTGILVKRGQALATVYSPELFATQRELLIARKSRDALQGSAFPEIASGAASLYESTRQRLKLWDISDGQIREIERKGSPVRAMAIHSPISGFVVARNAYPGQRITPETELYTVVDLSSIWVIADIYEYEVNMVKAGQDAVMTLPYNPGKSLKGTVDYIYPEVDRTTRTLKVRLQFPNPDFKLKPDMYANVEIRVDHGSRLSVPDEAILDSGTDQIVFIALDNGHFEPRKIEVGARVGNRSIVLGGLKAGDKVVSAGNFLVDSESQLKAALKGIAGGVHAGHGETLPSGDTSGSGKVMEDGTQPGPGHKHPNPANP